MSAHVTPLKDRVPFGQKAAFGAGHLVNNLLPGSLGVFAFFLLTAFGMDPFLAGLLGGLPRFFDAITDPIMGYISDNTTSRWGRRKRLPGSRRTWTSCGGCCRRANRGNGG